MALIDKLKDTIVVLPSGELRELADFALAQAAKNNQKEDWAKVSSTLEAYELEHGDIILQNINRNGPNYRILNYCISTPGIMEIEEMEEEFDD